MALSQLSPRRPYLLRAFYDWLLDNQLTPHLVVDVSLPGVQVPMEFARDGQIVLNIAPLAVGNLELADDLVRFNARFGGVPRQVMVPMAAVMAIYARENGAGTMFEPEPAYEAGEGADDEPHKPSLRTVDDVETSPSGNETPDDEPPSPPRGGRPSLRVVK
ncbi:ClpXP protease specificity-enhancing factor [Lonsdalea quercina]|uniref:ClpXP protease specificity-enhancing factor n=1 Tax=Lonsdalea quercina TaxID=71657 RepID=UPI003F46A822